MSDKQPASTQRPAPQGRRLFLAGMASLYLFICGAAPAQSAVPQVVPDKPEVRAAARELTDETGRRVLVPLEVRRIVSLAPNLTETLYALGAHDRLVGVTDYCDYPPEAQAKSRVGGAVNPNLEYIVTLKPDLVLATRALNRRETVEALDRLAIPVYATDPRSVAGVLESIRRVAGAIGAEEAGEALVAELQARLDDVARRLENLPRKRALFVVWPEPLISIGRDTFLADALRHAGADSLIDVKQEWPHVNLEEVVRLQPDYLIFASAHAEATQQTVDALREKRGWRRLVAVQQGRVAIISDAVNRPGPRLVDAIEQLARRLHPEAFDEPAPPASAPVDRRGGPREARP